MWPSVASFQALGYGSCHTLAFFAIPWLFMIKFSFFCMIWSDTYWPKYFFRKMFWDPWGLSPSLLVHTRGLSTWFIHGIRASESLLGWLSPLLVYGGLTTGVLNPNSQNLEIYLERFSSDSTHFIGLSSHNLGHSTLVPLKTQAYLIENRL